MKALLLLILCSAASAGTVTVYTYDSFAGKHGIGPAIAERLKKSGIETKFVPFGSAGEALNALAIEGKGTRADVVAGIDQSLLARAREIGRFEPFAEAAARVPAELRFDKRGEIVPFDYGYVTLVYDSRRTAAPAAGMSLREMARAEAYRKRIVIEDPRTSSLGLSFLLWTRALYPGAEAAAFWRDFAKQIVTVSPGWSGAYGLFLKKEADFVVTYTTSPAYHAENEKTDAFRGVAFPEGHYRQIEGAAVVRSSAAKADARKWVDALLSSDVQERIPTTQWMYPAVAGTKLPASFAKLPAVAKTVDIPEETLARSQREWVREWTAGMAARP